MLTPFFHLHVDTLALTHLPLTCSLSLTHTLTHSQFVTTDVNERVRSIEFLLVLVASAFRVCVSGRRGGLLLPCPCFLCCSLALCLLSLFVCLFVSCFLACLLGCFLAFCGLFPSRLRVREFHSRQELILSFGAGDGMIGIFSLFGVRR